MLAVRSLNDHPADLALNARYALVRTLVFFVVVSRVIARILFKVGQRIHRPHPIEKQHAIEMIGLVLHDTRGEILQLELEPLPVPIEGGH